MFRPFAVALVLTLPLTLAACGGSSDTGLHPVKIADPSASPDGREATATTFVGRVYDTDGTLVERQRLPRDLRPDDEWRTVLSAEQFEILRKQGTERAGTGALLKNKKDGVYTCAACGLPLFTSDTKFESGTGWPSFFREIDGNVEEREDDSHGMSRVEILCARCGGHLGHVFRDGPAPTRLRYCVNSVSLGFTPQEELVSLADPAAESPELAEAVFAGGCFWCVEAVFEEIDGVEDAISGYAGDDEKTATYAIVSTGRTKHAEAVKIIYDPTKVSYEDLLRIHFATHDPTQLNRQGNDKGPQYRSAIFYANEEQKELAQAIIEDLQPHVNGKIVTTLEPLTAFYPAERYHQNFVCNNPMQGYVRGVALPKVEKVREKFKDKLKAQSPLEKK